MGLAQYITARNSYREAWLKTASPEEIRAFLDLQDRRQVITRFIADIEETLDRAVDCATSLGYNRHEVLSRFTYEEDCPRCEDG
jgi:hypothetical protein